MKSPSKAPRMGIIVDASCIPVRDSITRDGFFHGAVEWQVKDLSTMETLMASRVYRHANVNQGEFLAIVDALSLLWERGDHHTSIYSDSLTAISWVRRKHPKSKHPLNDRTREIMDLVGYSTQWLRERHIKNPVIFWDKTHWGENPADYGRK